ncbi:MAG: YeeE/YedE thiosulfate transporter family protein [bacterium]|nr:YeeE/YedE thiosulfate transporter family protein [bacterium]
MIVRQSSVRAPGDGGAWSPYLAGALAGILSAASVLWTGAFPGASTTFSRAAGMAERAVSPGHVERVEYFRRVVPAVDWQFMFVVGIFFGALLSAVLSGSFRLQAVPDLWRSRFGPGIGRRAAAAFAGGAIAIFGARIAGGCPSGHGLSGLMQLSASGLVALACFFLGGIAVARALYGRGRGR